MAPRDADGGELMGSVRRSSEGLRVALMSTCAVPTPPPAYGGTELVLAALAHALAALGHRPTVFATGDSTCDGARCARFARPVWPPEPLAELRHASAAWLQIARGGFDVVHVNEPSSLVFTEWVALPTVATIHHVRQEPLLRQYVAYPRVAYVGISHRQAELAWEMPFRRVIHHGLDPDLYPEGRGDGGYVAFLGRLAAEKAPHIAIDAAHRVGLPIVVAGKPHVLDRDYFERTILPRFGPSVRWLGEVDQREKRELLRGARALLVPLHWEEPFGLVMIEAMLVGTPVIAFRCGAAPEIVDEGVTGFLVDTLEEMVVRLRDVGAIDRARCRARARERWSSERMARAYVDLYREVAFTASPRARGLRA